MSAISIIIQYFSQTFGNNMEKKRKKPETTRVPRTRNANTMTESQFWGMIRAALRNRTRYWKPVSVVRREVRRPYRGNNKRQKWEYQCNICKKWFSVKNTEVDHIVPAGKLSCYEDLPRFVKRLFVEKEGLQLVCNQCHNIKTKKERK